MVERTEDNQPCYTTLNCPDQMQQESTGSNVHQLRMMSQEKELCNFNRLSKFSPHKNGHDCDVSNKIVYNDIQKKHKLKS